nr:GAF domain-containing SpoIIE family protein phosphatase [Prochlorococcus sp. MIT 1223]
MKNSSLSNAQLFSPSSSFRELLDSLSREQKRNQELLSSLGFALRSFTNLSRFLEFVPVVITQLIGVEGCCLIPFHEDGRVWREQIHLSSNDDSQELVRQLSVFDPGKKEGFAFDENQLALLDSFFQSHFSDSGVFTTSLIARGRVRGRIYIFNTQKNCFWSDIHRQHVQLVADLTGVAIENDLVIQEIRRHESLDRQLSIGAEIQAQLLPDRCPMIEGIELAALCRPAFQVGGDYYDFMPTRPELLGRRRERGQWSFVIGDVMGKGIPAGLLMTMLRGMLRAEVISGLPPNQILHDLNQLALDDLAQSHRFVTLFYSDYDPRSRKLRFANAAHNPPLLWRAATKAISRLDSPGLLIGLQPDAEYVCGETILEPGDILLYYTDGVTEAQGLTGERFDEVRLIHLLSEYAVQGLSAKPILDKLFKRLDSFVGIGQHLQDDASMVVLKVNEDITLPNIRKIHH